jgi:hypothetical protein
MKPILTKLRTDKRSDSSSDVWTVFLNHDAALREAVLNVKPPTTFTSGWSRDKWTIDSYEGDEVKCTSGKNVKYFSKEEIEKIQHNLIKEDRIEKFNPFNKFFDQHGSLYRYQEYNDLNYSTKSIEALIGGESPGEESADLPDLRSHMGMCSVNEYEFNITKTEFQLRFKEHCSTGFMEYTDEGDFVNRDYNQTLQLFTQEKPDILSIYTSFQDAILLLGSLEKTSASNILYSDNFCYVPFINDDTWGIEFTLAKIPVRPDYPRTYQFDRGDTIFKKPAKTIVLTVDEVLSFIETEFTNKLAEKFTNA